MGVGGTQQRRKRSVRFEPSEPMSHQAQNTHGVMKPNGPTNHETHTHKHVYLSHNHTESHITYSIDYSLNDRLGIV